MKRIAVIGAGSSGIIAALQAAWNGADVVLFERNETVGRKLLVTGSGRCNLTNDGVAPRKYACADTHWMAALIDHFGVRHLLDMLANVGIPVMKTADGWYYPLSNSAQAVVDILKGSLEAAGVSIRTATKVVSIAPRQNGVQLSMLAGEREIEEEYQGVVLAAGGRAYPALGSTGELFPVLENLGHTVLPKRPALAPVLVDLRDLKALQGVRMDAGVSLWNDRKRIAEAQGNLIFTGWGLNGPAVMDISHVVSSLPDSRLTLSIDFLKPVKRAFQDMVDRARDSAIPARVFLEAFFIPKAASYFTQAAGIDAAKRMNQLDAMELKRLVRLLEDTRRPVQGVRGFEFCQVSAGGVPVTEVNPITLESRVQKGLYLCGETLDVVGPCGGYNLQFAFSSGALAGRAAARE